MSYEEPSYGNRKSKKEKRLKRRRRVYKRGGFLRDQQKC